MAVEMYDHKSSHRLVENQTSQLKEKKIKDSLVASTELTYNIL